MHALLGILRKLSPLLVIFSVGLLLFDLVNEWVFNHRLKIRNVEELWVSLSNAGLAGAVKPHLSFGRAWEMFLHLPAPAALLLVAAVNYILFRILFYLARGDSRSLL